jgi:hypothetical protein
MAVYKAPLRDDALILHEVLKVGNVLPQLSGLRGRDARCVDQVLQEAAKFSENELFPLNRSGDERRLVISTTAR